jgi:hypothetical protein
LGREENDMFKELFETLVYLDHLRVCDSDMAGLVETAKAYFEKQKPDTELLDAAWDNWWQEEEISGMYAPKFWDELNAYWDMEAKGTLNPDFVEDYETWIEEYQAKLIALSGLLALVYALRASAKCIRDMYLGKEERV